MINILFVIVVFLIVAAIGIGLLFLFDYMIQKRRREALDEHNKHNTQSVQTYYFMWNNNKHMIVVDEHNNVIKTERGNPTQPVRLISITQNALTLSISGTQSTQHIQLLND